MPYDVVSRAVIFVASLALPPFDRPKSENTIQAGKLLAINGCT